MFVSKNLSGLLSRKKGQFFGHFLRAKFLCKMQVFHTSHIFFFFKWRQRFEVFFCDILELSPIRFNIYKKKERKCIPKTLHGKKSCNNIKSAFCGIQTTNGHNCESWSDFALWHTYFCIVHCMYSPCNMKLLWIRKKKIRKINIFKGKCSFDANDSHLVKVVTAKLILRIFMQVQSLQILNYFAR